MLKGCNWWSTQDRFGSFMCFVSVHRDRRNNLRSNTRFVEILTHTSRYEGPYRHRRIGTYTTTPERILSSGVKDTWRQSTVDEGSRNVDDVVEVDELVPVLIEPLSSSLRWSVYQEPFPLADNTVPTSRPSTRVPLDPPNHDDRVGTLTTWISGWRR